MVSTGVVFEYGGYRAERLDTERDESAVQALTECCADYVLVVEGRPPGPSAARDFFQAAPPDWSPDDVDKLGIYDRDGRLMGLIESAHGYPEPGITHLGLMMLDPGARGGGLGAGLYWAYEGWSKARGAGQIRLGVVEDNEAAHRFWRRMGFRDLTKKPPEQMGEKRQAVWIMERMLVP